MFEAPKRAIADNLVLRDKVSRLESERESLLTSLLEKDTKIESLLDTISILELSLKEL